MTTSGPLTLTYVNVSNLKSDGTWTYNYDTENKLREVTRPGVVVQLNYDPFDRLFVTTATPGTLTKFLYDGDALIGEYDTNDQLQQRTVHGPGVDAPLVRYDAAGVRRWLHADERGSVVAESDASGQVVATYSYGPYGEPDSTAGGRLRYTGQMLIPELGLYHYRARTYSAYLGRFLQADPAGYADGLNLYAYVANDPINATDPSGLGAIYCRPNHTLTQTYTGVAVTNAKTGEVFFDGGWDITRNVTQLICDYAAEGIGGGGPINEPREDIDPCNGVLTTNPLGDEQTALNKKNVSTGQGDGAFGTARSRGTHSGIDITGAVGTPVYAAGDGTVVPIAPNPSPTYGIQVVIAHDGQIYTQYAHLNSSAVRPGNVVNAGERIGTVGTTGNTPPRAQPHLHFEVRVGSAAPRTAGGKVIDPQLCLPGGR